MTREYLFVEIKLANGNWTKVGAYESERNARIKAFNITKRFGWETRVV